MANSRVNRTVLNIICFSPQVEFRIVPGDFGSEAENELEGEGEKVGEKIYESFFTC